MFHPGHQSPGGANASPASARGCNCARPEQHRWSRAPENAAELSVKDIGLSGLGEIVFTVQNRGGVGINSAEKAADRIAGLKGVSAAVSTAAKVIKTPPIELDIYVGGTKLQAQFLASLAGEDSKTFVVTPPNFPVPACNDVRAIKIVVDPANVVPELQEDNNTAAVTVARPCPDLAIKSIEREKSGMMGESYRVKVTVINLGNAPAPASEVWGTAVNDFPVRRVGPRWFRCAIFPLLRRARRSSSGLAATRHPSPTRT